MGNHHDWNSKPGFHSMHIIGTLCILNIILYVNHLLLGLFGRCVESGEYLTQPHSMPCQASEYLHVFVINMIRLHHVSSHRHPTIGFHSYEFFIVVMKLLAWLLVFSPISIERVSINGPPHSKVCFQARINVMSSHSQQLWLGSNPGFPNLSPVFCHWVTLSQTTVLTDSHSYYLHFWFRTRCSVPNSQYHTKFLSHPQSRKSVTGKHLLVNPFYAFHQAQNRP